MVEFFSLVIVATSLATIVLVALRPAQDTLKDIKTVLIAISLLITVALIRVLQ